MTGDRPLTIGGPRPACAAARKPAALIVGTVSTCAPAAHVRAPYLSGKRSFETRTAAAVQGIILALVLEGHDPPAVPAHFIG